MTIGRWLTILFVLIERTYGERFHRSQLAGLISVFEPLGVIMIFTFLHGVGPSAPPFGPSTAVFFATGVIPFYMFFHVSVRLRNIDGFPPLFLADRFHHILARCIGEFTTKIAIFVAFLIAIDLTDYLGLILPSNTLVCLAALIALATAGAAVGVINSCLISLFSTWIYVYAVCGRVLMIVSGISFVHDRTPEPIRTVLDWSPISHWVVWFRTGFYGDTYPSARMDLLYAGRVTCIAVALAYMIDVSSREFRSTEQT